MVRTDTRRTARHRVAAGVLGAALAAAAPALAAAPPGHSQTHTPFGPEHAPVAEAKLAEMRGGFETPSGETINVGIAVTGTVTGPNVPDFEFTIGQRIDESPRTIRKVKNLKTDEIQDFSGMDPSDINGSKEIFSLENDQAVVLTDTGALKVAGGAADGGVTVQAAADATQALKTLLQAGQGNSAPDVSDIGAEGLANVIQNNLNNIDIDLTNQIDLDTSMDLGSSAVDRITDAVRAVQTGGL